MIHAFLNLIGSALILLLIIFFIIGVFRGTPDERQANALEDIRNELKKKNKESKPLEGKIIK